MSIEANKKELAQQCMIIINRMITGYLTDKEFYEADKKLETILAKMKELQSEVIDDNNIQNL